MHLKGADSVWVQCGQNISVLSSQKQRLKTGGREQSLLSGQETTYIKFVTILLSSLAHGLIIKNIIRVQLHFLYSLVLS